VANSATAKTAIPIKHPYLNSITPIVLVLDTVQSDLTVLAAQGAGKIIAVYGGALQNNHASGAQTLLWKSSSAGEILRWFLAASNVLNLASGLINNTSQRGLLSNVPGLFTQPNEGLVLRLNDATNQPINGVVYVGVIDTTATGGVPLI